MFRPCEAAKRMPNTAADPMSRWDFAVNGLAGDEADGSSHVVKVFTELTVVEVISGPAA
jgi:hypothetical protein